jgi:hypothetical protein
LQGELALLTAMKSDFREFFNLADKALDASTHHRLQEESAVVLSALEFAEQLEQNLKQETAQQKEVQQNRLQKEQEQLRVSRAVLETDRNYVQELEKTMLENPDEVQEEDRVALAEEKTRIEGGFFQLEHKEQEVEDRAAEEIRRIDFKYHERMGEITIEKSKAKEQWKHLVKEEMQQRQNHIKDLDTRIDDRQKRIDESTAKLENLQIAVAETEQLLDDKRTELQELEVKQEEDLAKATEEVSQLNQIINTHEMENEVSDIHNQLQRFVYYILIVLY